MKNFEVARLFDLMADVLELRGENVFRIRAYRRAAQNVESMTEDVEAVAREGRLDDVPGIGKDLAGKIVEYLETGKVKEIEAAGVRVVERAVRPTKGRLAGWRFVLTGKLAGLTREEARRLIEARGGRVADAVSKRTGVVVGGEGPGQKLDAAHRLGIPTINEHGLRRLVGAAAD